MVLAYDLKTELLSKTIILFSLRYKVALYVLK